MSESAIAFAWLVIGSAVLSRLRFSHSLLGLAVYTVWGTLGIVLFLKNAFHAAKGKSFKVKDCNSSFRS